MKKAISVKEAIESGYTYCGEQDADPICIKIETCDFSRGKNYFVYDKKPFPYQIAENEIMDLLDDHLCNQDECYDEDGKLNDILAKIDFTQITAKVNEAFADGPKFWMPTDIKLVP